MAPVTAKTLKKWSKFDGLPPQQLGVEHLSCEEKLRELGLCRLKKTELCGDPIGACWYL